MSASPSSNGAAAASAAGIGTGAAGNNNRFADINAKEFLAQPPTPSASVSNAAAGTASPSAAAPSSGSNSSPAAPQQQQSAPASVPAPIARGPVYNPNAKLHELDPTSLMPDESENARLSASLQNNVATLIATKQANERKQQVVGSILSERYKQAEAERGKLLLIRQELAKLDQSLVRNIDVLRAEIEGVGREVNNLQRDFDLKEKEYLALRKALAKTKQRKLLLTSHLDYIILTNENDKARKLTELEMSLGLTPSSPVPPVAELPSAPGVRPPAFTGVQVAAPAATATATRPAGAASPGGSMGASPAAIAAAAESERRHAALVASQTVPRDHPGLSLEAVAPPAFAGFVVSAAAAADDANDRQELQQILAQRGLPPMPEPTAAAATPATVCTNPFGPPSPVPAQHQQQRQQHQRQPSHPQSAARASPGSSPNAAALAAQARHVSLPPRGSPSSSSAAGGPSPPAATRAAVVARPAREPMALSHLSAHHHAQHNLPEGSFAGFGDE